MRLIIAGSRYFDMTTVRTVLHQLGGELPFQVFVEGLTEIVSGGAAGVDLAGEFLAAENGLLLKRFPADWKKHGIAAGPRRNTEMAKYADKLLLIWDGKSRGSASMKAAMEKVGKPIWEVVVHGSD